MGRPRILPEGSRTISVRVAPDTLAALADSRRDGESESSAARRVLRKALGLPEKIPRDEPPPGS